MPFKTIYVRWCSCGDALFDVTWADDTKETLHWGTLPTSLSRRQSNQLRESRQRAERRKALAS